MFNGVKRLINNYKEKSFYARVGEKAFSRESIDVVSNAGGSGGILVTLSKRLGMRNGDVTSKDYEEGEYAAGLMEIDKAYETDSYVRQGLDKYLEQTFKEGFEIFGTNPSTVEYIEARLLFIAEASKIPTKALVTAIAEDVVKYSNSIILKARKQDETQLPPTSTVTGIDGKEPIVALFPAHPGTFKVKRDRTGLVQGWMQEVDGGDKELKFRAEDVLHISYKRKRGDCFGQPFILSVLDDVKALRFMEENVINMIYKHVNPFLHAKIGDKEAPGTKDEVDDVERSLSGMDPEGGFVSTNRVEIATVATNNAVNAREYLDYQEARVFTGMGVPGIAMGRGGTANRNTADAMTAEMADRIKAIQRVIEDEFNNQIIKELLQEGGFDPLTNPLDMVYLRFKENDLDKKIKFENHCTFLFEHNAIDENEMRDLMSRDPITDRALLHHELYTMTALAAKSAPGESGNGSGSGASKKDTNNKNKPTNQSGTKPSSKKTTNSTKTIFINDDTKEVMNTYALSSKEATLVTAFAKSISHNSEMLFIRRINAIINHYKKERK